MTFVPIPNGAGRYAGLLSVELPAGIKRGEAYDILVRDHERRTRHKVAARPNRAHAGKAANPARNPAILQQRIERRFRDGHSNARRLTRAKRPVT